MTADVAGSNLELTIDGTVVSTALSGLTSVTITGGDGNDSFTIGPSLAGAGISFTFDGGGGNDTLNGPPSDSTWNVTGEGSGTVGNVAFQDFENLTGAANNKDTFDFSAAGSLSGTVDGGAGGYDIVGVASDGTPVDSTITGAQSGTISRGPGNVITYAGMEPVSVSGTNKVTINVDTDSVTIDITDDATAANGAFKVDPNGTGESHLITTTAASPVDLTVNLHGGTNLVRIHNMDTAYTGTIHVAGASGVDTFDLHDLTGYTGAITLTGNGGNDVFKLGNAFGHVTIADAVAADTLDLTGRNLVANPLTVDTSKNFTSSDGSSLTQTGTRAGTINVSFANTPAAAIETVANDLSSVATSLQSAADQLKNQLPFLPASLTGGVQSSISSIVGFATKLSTIATDISGAIASETTLKALVDHLNAVSWPSDIPITASTQYRGEGTNVGAASGTLEVLLDLNVPLHTLTPIAASIDLSSLGSNVGVSFSGTPGFTLTPKYSLDVRIGVSTDQSVPVVFLDPGSKVHVEISATTGTSLHGVTVNLGFLSATLGNTAQITFSGGLDATATDPDNNGHITPGELTSAGASQLLALTDNPVSSLAGTLSLTITGVNLAGGTPLASGTLTFSLTGSIFGAQGAQPNVQVNLTTSPSVTGLLDKFKNVGPSDVLGMLNQILGLLSSMASSSAINLPIPFTSITLGEAINYATSFKHTVLDPLFKSGDAFKPDANGDGNINAADINFSSVQDMLSRIEKGLGLAPGTLTATFDPATGVLSFPFSFDTNLGIGTPVVVSSATGASVTTLYDGSSSGTTQDELQILIVNGAGGTFSLGGAGHTVGPYTVGASNAATIQSDLRSILGSSLIFVSQDATLPNVYVIRFDHSLGNVGEVAADGSSVTGTTNAVQYVLAPGTTQSFWLGYPISTGDHSLALSAPLGPGSSASTVQTQLRGLDSTLSSLTVLGTRLSSALTGHVPDNLPGVFKVTLTGVSSPVPIVATGGFNLDFGTSFGDFGGVSTKGSIIPLASLTAHLVFGVNLNASTSLSITPAVGQPGPNATVAVTQQGGTTINIQTKVAGDSSTEAVQVLTVRGTGTFTIAGHSESAGVSQTTLATDLGGVSVTRLDTAEGHVYTITWTSNGLQTPLAVNGSGLSPIDTIQHLKIANANGGTYVISNGSGATPAITLGTSPASQIGTLVSDTVSVTGGSLVGLIRDYTITFNGSNLTHTNVPALAVDGSQLTGALTNGQLLGDASFSVTLYNGTAISVVETQVPEANGNVSTTTDGGRLASVASAGSMTYTLTVRGAGGTLNLSFGGNTTTVPYNVAAGTCGSSGLCKALEDLASVGSGHVTVTSSSAANGDTVFTVAFTVAGTLTASTLAATMATQTQGTASSTETQTLNVTASDGSISFGFPGAVNTTPYLGISTLTAGAIESALNTLTGITAAGGVTVTGSGTYSIHFTGNGDQPLISIDASTLVGRNEVQSVAFSGVASSGSQGSFKLAYGGQATSGLDYATCGHACVQSALEGLTGIGTGNVLVTGSAGGPFTVTFGGNLVGANAQQLAVDVSGVTPQNEQQTITLLNTNGGKFTLSFNGAKTAAQDWNVGTGTLAGILSTLVGQTVAVTGTAGHSYVVEFQGTNAGHVVANLVADGSALTNSTSLATFSVTIATADTSGNSSAVTCDSSHNTSTNLGCDIQTAVNNALKTAGLTPGFFSSGTVTNGGVSSIAGEAAPFTATSGALPWDVAFTLVSNPGSSQKVATGTLRASRVADIGIAAALAEAIKTALSNASISGLTVNVSLSGGKLQFAPTGQDITFDFASPLTVNIGGGRATVAPVAATDSYASNRPPAAIQPRVDINLDYANSAFQELGLSSSPTRVDYSSGTKNKIAFTLTANGVDLPVDISSTSWTTIDGLVTTVQNAVNAALDASSIGMHQSGGHDIVHVCRIDPSASDGCGTVGNRIAFTGLSGFVTSLGITVPETYTDGTPNGAITNLGLAAGESGDQTAKASAFFIDDVSLTGKFQFVVSNATATLTLGFLSLTATGNGTLPLSNPLLHRLIDLTGSLRLLNPAAAPGSDITVTDHTLSDPTLQDVHITASNGEYFSFTYGGKTTGLISVGAAAADVQAQLRSLPGLGSVTVTGTAPNYQVNLSSVSGAVDLVGFTYGDAQLRLDLGALVAAIGQGKIFYDPTQAGGSVSSPGTGFVLGSISGGLAGKLTLTPDGYLSGLTDLGFTAEIDISMNSGNWLNGIPPPSFEFHGPDVQSILDQFKNLDFGTIVAGLNAVVSFLQSLSSSSGAVSTVLDTKLPLVDKSINDLLSAVQDIANKVNAIIANPAGAVQQLNNLIANALGFTVPSIPVSVAGSVENVEIDNALHGTFTLTYKGQTTTTLQLGASATDIKNALEALSTVGVGNVTTLTGLGTHASPYVVTFGFVSPATLTGDASRLVNTSILSWDGTNKVLNFDLNLATSTQLTQPFNLDLAQVLAEVAGPDDAFANAIKSLEASGLIGVGASGTLALSASASFDVKLGLQVGTPANVDTTIQGGSTQNEKQTLTFTGTTGTVKLEFDANNDGAFTADEKATTSLTIGTGTTAAQVLTALNSIAALNGKVSVTGPNGGPYTIEFTGTGVSDTNVAAIKIPSSGSFFIATGNTGTNVDLKASVTGTNLNFNAKLGPIGIFITNGSASLGAELNGHLIDPLGSTTPGRFNIVSFDADGIHSDFSHIGDYFGAGSLTFTNAAHNCPTGSEFACANLPIFVGTASTQVPIDFMDGNPGQGGPGLDNVLRLDACFSLSSIIGGPATACTTPTYTGGHPLTAGPITLNYTLPNWGQFNPQLPSLFTLLSDPSTLVDGLDTVLGVIQGVLGGEVFGVKLPLIGDALKDNPVVDAIESFRESYLQPLANFIRENNLDLEGVVNQVVSLAVSVLENIPDIGSLLPDGSSDVEFKLLNADHTIACSLTATSCAVNIFNAQAAEFQFKIGKNFNKELAPINIDIGVPALGLKATFTPTISISFGLRIGFGVDLKKGFFLATSALPGETDTPELSLSATVNFSSSDCSDGSGKVNRANIDGSLLFLALKLQDGVDLNNNGTINVQCDGTGPNATQAPVDPQTYELSGLFLNGSIDIVDSGGHGYLTFSDLASRSLTDIVHMDLRGGAMLRADATVDFSTLGADLGNILPSIHTKILVDFGFSWSLSGGFNLSAPQVVLGDITLDLGSFISDFAAPILNQIKKILDPLSWLIGPDGFLNARIPLLSDLAGHTVTGADLVEFFDPSDAPTIKAFLSFVNELYHLIDLVQQVAASGHIALNFGDMVIIEGTHPATPDPHRWAFYDQAFSLTGFGGAGGLSNFNNASLPSNLPTPQMEGTPNAAATEFGHALGDPPGETAAFDFPILTNPSILFNLILGKPVTLVEITLPELSFNFYYRQQFPIIGPLVGTFAGGIAATIDLRFGYDTLGLSELFGSGNPADLVDGFFFDTKDAQGNPLPVATLQATIAVGAAISLVLVSAGVEGGITATIHFSWDDLNGDGKVRLKELAANLVANDFDPLAVFDINGNLQFFLRAYVEINLFITKITLTFEFARITLFSFDIPFNRPSFLATQNGGTIALAVGADSKNRLQGNLSDIGETIFVKSNGGAGKISVYSSQFNSPDGNPLNEFEGVTAITADAGAGDDYIDLSGLDDTTITVIIHGGAGNDKLVGPLHSKCTMNCDDADATTHVFAQLYGDGGDDTLTSMSDQKDLLNGGDGADILTGGAGNSLLQGGAGTDHINGGAGAETIDPGSGDDLINGGGGSDTILGGGIGSGPEDTSSGGSGPDTLDFSTRAENLTIKLRASDGKILIGWGALTGVDTWEHMLIVDHMDSVGTIIGGKGADLFDVFKTPAAGITLDGGKGDDTYDFHWNDGFTINATVTDNGNPWNSGDTILADGSTGNDTFFVSDSAVCDTTGCGGSDVVHYTSPAYDANVLQIRVLGNAGNDTITVKSTSVTVPVSVDGGTGDDLVTVGTAADGLTNIVGISRPNVNQPDGVGPVQIVGGSGHDVLIVDNQGDSGTNETGRLTAFNEQRAGAPVTGDEVGLVSGLSMLLWPDGPTYNTYHGSDLTKAGAGRVEFAGVESVVVKLGSGGTTFEIGGDGGLLGSGASALPQARQATILGFVSTPSAMVSVEGGNGGDTIRVFGTNTIDRDILNSTGFLQVSTIADGITAISDEQQLLSVPGGVTGYYTLTVNGHTTAQIALSSDAAAIATALANAGVTGVTVTNPVGGKFMFDFSKVQGDVAQIVATLRPHITSTGTHTQEIDMPTGTVGVGFFTLTLNGTTTGLLPLDATQADIQAALQLIDASTTVSGAAGKFTATFSGTPALMAGKIVPVVRVSSSGGDNSTQTLTIPSSATSSGYFTLQYSYQETAPISLGAGHAAIEQALQALQLLNSGGLPPNVTVSGAGHGPFTVSFNTGVLGPVPVLVARVVPLEITGGTGDDRLRLQANFEDLFYSGGDGQDNVNLNIDAHTLHAFTDAEVHAVIATTVNTGGGGGLDAEQHIDLSYVTGGQFTLSYGVSHSAPLYWDVSTDIFAATIEKLVGGQKGDVSVSRTATGYDVKFQEHLANHAISQLLAAGSGQYTPGVGVSIPYALLSNGVNANVTLDGQGDGDLYTINTIGGTTNSVINTFDRGATGVDQMTVNGTTNPDYFLLRAATSDSGLAFIALVNAPDVTNIQAFDPVERINYEGVDHITLNTITNTELDSHGVPLGDQVYVDDSRAIIDVFGGDGPDQFQVGQLYQSRRTPSLAGVMPGDVFATIETTQGWLSNGITNPMTINGGDGNDTFIVFHNLGTLTLNGDDGNDTFLVQAFALAGSQDDFRALTDLSGGAGADLIQYAVNAPVHIDGGDGFDTVIVIGTEFGDDFVVTKSGVFGAGLMIDFVNIESLVVDGGAGDDRFFVLSTGIGFKTTVDGGLGTDLISVQGPTPADGVISNTLLGHSGIITNDVEQTVDPDQYSGLKVVGISGNVYDNDAPAVIVLQSNGYSQVIQGAGMNETDQGLDSYTIVLARPPVLGSYVQVQVVPPPGLVLLDGSNNPIRTTSSTTQLITLANATGGYFTLGGGSDMIPFDATMNDVVTALNHIGHTGATVVPDGTTYEIDFIGAGDVMTDVALLSLDATHLEGGTATIEVTQHGGLSIPGGLNLCWDNGDAKCPAASLPETPAGKSWYQSFTVKFAVDEVAAANGPIPSTGEIQQKITTSDNGRIVAHVDMAIGVDSENGFLLPGQSDLTEDANPLPGGDEWGTLSTIESTTFSNYLPSEQLPEGIRGAYLKVTGGDDEASGQIRLIEGSYIEVVDVSGGSTFKLTISGTETGDITYGSDLTDAIKSALVAALGGSAGSVYSVKKTSADHYQISLGSNLYLAWDATHSVAGIGVDRSGIVSGGTIDATAVKLNAPWSVEPAKFAQFEVDLYSAVQAPTVLVRIYSEPTPAVVVDETHGSTSVSEMPLSDSTAQANASDTIRVRLSNDPGISGATVNLTNVNDQISFWDGSTPITSLSFTGGGGGDWSSFKTVTIKGKVDGVVENFQHADLTLSATGFDSYSTIVDVGDADYPGVRVLESDGATTVSETTTQFGVAESSTSGIPFTDSYQLVLTEAPTGGVVTVTTTAQPTRTSLTGGIVSYSQQLVVCLITATEDCTNPGPTHFKANLPVSFDGSNWYKPQTIVVRAKGNDRVDGGDTHVFAPTLDQLGNIQGPLFINGAEGDNYTGLLEREPLMLPHERNLKPAMGAIVDAHEAVGLTPANVTLDMSQILTHPLVTQTLVDGGGGHNEQQQLTVNAIGGTFTLTYGGVTTDEVLPYNASALQVETALESLSTLAGKVVTVSKNSNVFKVTFLDGTFNADLLSANNVDLLPLVPADLKNFSVEVTSGPAKNKIRIITGATDAGGGHWLATLATGWLSPFDNDATVPTGASTFTLFATNPNLLVDEKQSTDILQVWDTDNPGSYNDSAYTSHHGGADNPFAVGTLSYEQSTAYDHTVSVSGEPLDQFRIQGFGMGLDRTIGTGMSAQLEPGGITFRDIEDLQVTLGSGADKFTINDTPSNTKVSVDTGKGNDVVYINAISGHTSLDLGAGNDTVYVDQMTQTLAQLYGLLTVAGDIPQAVVTNLVNGSPQQGTAVDAVNAQQRIVVDATDGTYKLTVSDGTHSATTAAIGSSATSASVQTALEDAINTMLGHSLGTHQVTVHKAGNLYVVTFDGDLAGMPIPLLVSHDLTLTNGAGENDTLNVYDNSASGADSALLTSSSLSGLDFPQTNTIQEVVVDGNSGSFTLTFGGTTITVPYGTSAHDLQGMLQGISAIGTGNVAVALMDDVYVLRFQGGLSNTAVPLVAVNGSGLTKLTEHLGGGVDSTTGNPLAAQSSIRVPGFVQTAVDTNHLDPFAVNDVQVLTVNATGGTYKLSLVLPNNAGTVTTDAIAYDATADVVRQALQNAIVSTQVAGNPYLIFKFDVMVDRYRDGKNQAVYTIGFQGVLRQNTDGPGANFLSIVGSSLAGGSASLATRMDGIDYFGIETLNIGTGTGSDVFSVQGTTSGSNGYLGTAVTNVDLGTGDNKVFISSNADQDQSSWQGIDYLTGNLDDVLGALNLNLGTGRHKLFVSDEASIHADAYSITDTKAASLYSTSGLADGADIYLTRAGRPGISYVTAGNLFDGVTYWTGSGNDTVFVNGTKPNGAQRTTTILDIGLGNDNVTVNLTAGSDGFFVLETSGGQATNDPIAHGTPATSDNDTVDASTSSLSLIIIGGFGKDTIRGGSGNDIILGDLGVVQYAQPGAPDTLLAQFGFGGRGDVIDAQGATLGTPIYDPRWVYTRAQDYAIGANDTIYGNGGEDILIGGAASDAIDGGTADDLIFGDAVVLFRRNVQPGVTGDITNPRFQALSGTQIYSTTDATLGQAQNNGTPQSYRDGDGLSVPDYAPDWAEYQVRGLYHTYGIQALNDNSFGNDYIAGGPADDMIFGELGNDVIQGDGSIGIVPGGHLTCTGGGTVGAADWSFADLVGACRDAGDSLQLNASVDNYAGTDGSDYIEGGGGSDVIFGNQGQDDIVGGNSDLFSLGGACTAATETSGACKRPDLPNLIFGGSGTDVARDDMGPSSTNADAHDADAIVAGNGDIVRIVGTNGTPHAGFLQFAYDSYSATEHIVPRSIKLIDYTPGGADLQGTTGPIVSGDIGAGTASWYKVAAIAGQAAGTEIHGENGDDFVYGGAANDVLFGDAQNDVLIGGYGNDWISGGTGEDGALGDDGRMFVSRVGTAEPLYAIPVDANLDQLISSPGTFQQAIINHTGALRYTAVLTPDNLDPSHAAPNTNTPRPVYANDVIYGGWGDDALHGGAGDDAMSGAEALAVSYTNNFDVNGAKLNALPIESDFAHPFNPGNVLGYSPATTKLAEFDAVDPFREITLVPGNGALDKSAAGGLLWLLDFATTEPGEPVDTIYAPGSGYPSLPTDGNDALFGDLSNDWLVGGTGRDTMYGGWGNDLLNADDNLTTGGSVTNVGNDTNPAYEDMAFGGAGRDVLEANTGGDRLIDWLGEFNTYEVEFAAFGMATRSTQLVPDLPDYLYKLSLSDGADPFFAAHYGSAAARNGEPFGELGLILQTDVAWGDQMGSPRDPQAGNLPGVHFDVRLTSGVRPIFSPDTDPPAGVTPGPVTPPTTTTPTMDAQNIQSAIVEGATIGLVSASFESTLLTQIQQVIKALQSSNASAKVKLAQFISTLQSPPAGAIASAFQQELLALANDLLSRL